jgi:hypothetical protein
MDIQGFALRSQTGEEALRERVEERELEDGIETSGANVSHLHDLAGSEHGCTYFSTVVPGLVVPSAI